MSARTLVLGAAVLGAAAATGGAAAGRAPAVETPPLPPATSFSARVTNPWFPLRPGTRWLYTGVKDGKPSRDVVTVSHRLKTVAGVPCVVVEDRLYLRGHLEERTSDWYSQDARGSVWYFGEDTAELDAHGKVTSREGSWEAGVRGARPGIFMPARPRIGAAGVQEVFEGRAEDHFRVIGLFGAGGGASNALLTEEWTPLEPGVLDHKLYVRGIGTVLEQTEKGGDERNELVSVTRGH